jgi:hypothetical protein
MLMTPSTPGSIVKGNAVVAIGVDRCGDGRDNSASSRTRTLVGRQNVKVEARATLQQAEDLWRVLEDV